MHLTYGMTRRGTRFGLPAAGIILALTLAAYRTYPRPAAAPTASVAVGLTIRNVAFRFDRQLILYIESLDGDLVPARPGTVPNFDHKDSFLIVIRSARVAMDANSLARLLNGYVFADPGSGLQQSTVKLDYGRIEVRGKIKKSLGLGATITGTMEATSDGQIAIHTTQIRALHLPVKGVLHALGLHVSDFVNAAQTRGLSVDKQDMTLNPEIAFPAPQIRGKVRSASIQNERLWLEIGSGTAPSAPPNATDRARDQRGYMRFSGGVLEFGKMTMRPADLTILNASATGPLDFFLDQYQRQLVAGTIQATRDYGWVVHMPGWGLPH